MYSIKNNKARKCNLIPKEIENRSRPMVGTGQVTEVVDMDSIMSMFNMFKDVKKIRLRTLAEIWKLQQITKW